MRTLDRTGTYFCPGCGGRHDAHYEEVPEHDFSYTEEDGTEVTVYLSETREYECSNCGFTWWLDPAQET